MIIRPIIISPHGIAMPKCLYFTAVVFFFLLFSAPVNSEVTERISAKLGHIFTYDCYLKKIGPNSLGIYAQRPEAKSSFRDRLWTLTKHISATEHDTNNRKEICQSTGTPLHSHTFGELWSTNGWERLASFCSPPPKILHWETLPALPHGRYITDSRQTLARVI